MSDDIFSRWSRRKRAVAEEHTETPEPPVEPDPELSEPELLDQLGLPNPDTLQEGDDFAAFMRDNVPQFLRKRALKRLWLSNPALANLDGLVDYGEDFTDAAMVPEVLETAYKVGKGIWHDIVAEPAPAEEDEEEAEEDEMPKVTEIQDDPNPDVTPEIHVNNDVQPIEPELEEPEFRPRRMAFRAD